MIPGLHGKMTVGVMWSLFQIVSERLVQTAVFLIAARLLGPSEFGLAALVVAPTAIATHVVRGVVQALVQKPAPTRSFLSACFWFALAVSLAMSAVLVGIAPIVASTLDAPEYVPLMLVCAVAPIAAAIGVVSEGSANSRFRLPRPFTSPPRR